jgi:hypothetical protein
MGERTRRVVLRECVLRLLLTGTTFSGLSCGGDSLAPPTAGRIQIVTATSGPEPDPDGYTISIDQGPETPIAVNGTMQSDELDPGAHEVQLGGLAANCAVQGENPRTITVGSGEAARADFAVACGATTGALSVSAVTSGPAPDADGYTVLVDGTERGPIGASNTIVLNALVPGPYSVGLSGLAGNCRGEGDVVRPIVVTAGSTATVNFAVSCAALPAAAGTLRVTTHTSGSDVDPDGYTLAVDAGASQPMGTEGTVTLDNLVAGVHTVQLSDNESNCRIAGTNPRTVTVPDGGRVDLTFTVTCTARPPTTGTLQVTTSTTGVSPDADGYSVSTDGGTGQPIGVNESITIRDLTPGSHNVGLSGISANCQVDAGNPRAVTIAAGQTATAAFNITCTAPPPSTGTLRVVVATSGPDQDPDGYTLAIDDKASQAISVNGTVSIADLASGVHTVQLSGVIENCTLGGTNPRSVTVPAGGIADVSFSIACTATTGSIRVNVATTGDPVDPDGYTLSMNWEEPTIAIGTNATHTFELLPAGYQYVVLTGLDSHCHVGEDFNLGSDSYISSYASATGEITYYAQVKVVAGETATIDFNVVCTDQISIVLTWGGNPLLDSHLTGPTPEGSGFHVYRYDSGSLVRTPFAQLIYHGGLGGPETTVITQLTEGTYRYMVVDSYHSFNHLSSTELGTSAAKVEVYTSQGLVQTFLVPNEPGTLWTVFEITGGGITNPSIIPVNTMSYESPFEQPGTTQAQAAAAGLMGRAVRPQVRPARQELRRR